MGEGTLLPIETVTETAGVPVGEMVSVLPDVLTNLLPPAGATGAWSVATAVACSTVVAAGRVMALASATPAVANSSGALQSLLKSCKRIWQAPSVILLVSQLASCPA